MANNTEDIKWLYGKLKAKGYDIGSEQDFTASLANAEDRDWYYNKAVGMGLDMGSKEDFNAIYAPQPAKPAQAPAAAPTSQQSAAPNAQADTARTATLPPSPASTQSAPATNQAAQGQSTAPAPQPTWQPSEQDKIRMAYNLNSMMADFNARSRARVEQTRRATERFTPEGRRKLKAAKFQAQLAGTPTQVLGLTPDVSVSPSGQSGQGEGGEQAKPLLSGQGPVPYGVVEVDGQRKTQWLLPDGSLTTDFAEADKAEYGARRVRLMNQFVGRMKENGLDPSKQEDVQRQAQLDYEAPIRKAVAAAVQVDDERSDKEQEAYMSNTLNMIGGVNAALGHAAARKQAGIGDLNLIAENAYNSLPSAYRRDLIASYTDYFTQHPEQTHGKTIEQAANDAAKSVVYGQVHEEYVKRNGPQSKNEFFLRKMLELNPASVALSGTINPYGQAYAELDAMERYGADHRGLSIMGTVAGMAIDPTTYLGGWAGNIAFKNATRAAGKYMAKKAIGDVAGRYAATTLTGRIIGGMAAGGTNFGTFEAVKDAERQLYQGGYKNPETGEMEGFTFGSVLNSGVHGVFMGAATGVVSPLIGNVADKAVKATTSTAGKVAMRGTEVLTSTLAEGTIFSIPEWISGDQDAFDVWTDNMAMMAGFKLSHGIKTAPEMIRSLRPAKPTGDRPLTRDERIHNNKSFAERLRERMDQSPADIAMTAEEREELRRRGYGELSDLFAYDPEHKSRKVNAVHNLEGDYTGITGLSRAVDYEARPDETGNPAFDGYEAMERLMEDGSVSEATRAKAYYILTGRNLPMSTVTGWSTIDNGDGTTTVTSSSNEGNVVTSRTFYLKKDVEREIGRIKRQAELNTIDVGEQYAEARADDLLIERGYESYAQRRGVTVQSLKELERRVNDYEEKKRQGIEIKEEEKPTELDGIWLKELEEAIHESIGRGNKDVRPEGIRERVSKEMGVDIDKAIRKEPEKRSEAEHEAVERYARELFPKQETYEPTPEEAEADRVYEESRLLFGRFEQGDPGAQAEIDAISLRMEEAHQLYEDAFGDEAEVYMAEIKENPWGILNDPYLTPDQKDAVLYYINANAALDGVLDASNEAAADKRQRVESEVARRTHKERGVVVPATMKADDQPVYIINGEVAMFPDGSGVDARNSSDSVIILDETGEYKFTSPDQILSVGETIDPQTELQAAYEAIDREQEAIISAATEGVPETSESVPNSGENGGNAAETGTGSPETVPNVEEYDRGYEDGTQVASTLDDNTLNTAIEDLRSRDWLSDEWRGRLEAYEYEQQARALAAQSAPDPNIGLEGPQTAGDAQWEELNRGGNAEENLPDNAPEGQEGETATSALARIPLDDKTGDPHLTHESVDAETAWDAAVEFFGGNEDALGYVQSQINTSKAEIGKAEKEISKVKPTGGMTKYRDDLAKARAKVEAAKQEHERWKAIEAAQQRKKMQEVARRLNEQRERDAQLHDEAVARFEEEQRAKAERQAEQEARGAYVPHPDIKKKWDDSPKYYGPETFITLANGKVVNGRYVYHEAFAVTPSHDPFNGFQISEGSPLTPEGLSVNPRQYDADSDARRHTESIAGHYDARGIREDKVVQEGNMLSGNGGASARQLAARQGTDTVFIEALRTKAKEEGISEADFNSLEHPDRSFEPDEKFSYTPETYDIFNADSKKSMSRDEQSVRHGMTVSDDTFARLTDEIGRFDSLDDFYRNPTATNAVLRILHGAGTITDNEMAKYRNGEELSGTGEDLIENILMGKVFDGDPNAIRRLAGFKQMRRSVLNAMNEIAANHRLEGSGYGLDAELAKAIDLAARAKASSEIYDYGMPVSPFGRMQGLFDDEYGDSRVTDVTVLLLADMLNSNRPNDLRKVLALYNKEAGEAAAGAIDLFNPEARPYTKEEVLTEVNNIFKNADPREQQRMVEEAIAARRNGAEQETGRGIEGVEQAPDSGQRGAGSQERAGGADSDLLQKEKIAPVHPSEMPEGEKERRGELLINAPAIEVVKDSITSTPTLSARKAAELWWDDNVGEAVVYDTEVGEVEINRNSVESSLAHRYGQAKLDAITSLADGFENSVYLGSMPDFTRHGGVTNHFFAYPILYNGERCYVFCRAMQDANKNRLYVHEVFVSDKLRKGNTLQTAASQPHGGIALYRDILANVLETEVHSRPALGSGKDTDTTEVISGHTEGATAPAGNSSMPSGGKDNALSTEKQAKGAESSGATEIKSGVAKGQRMNLNPTETQKEAGNYKKGHVSVAGMNISIENPKRSKRSGTDADGKAWETKMTMDYGYIRGTTGKDKDHIDIFLTDMAAIASEESLNAMGMGGVYVIDQYNKDGSFDEHKIVYGVENAQEAREKYLGNYTADWAEGRLIEVTETTMEDFKKWAFDGRRKIKPFAEYKSVKALTEDADQARTNIAEDGMITEDGKPITFYHGTPNDVTALSQLEPGHARKGETEPARFNGNGVSFTPNRDVAQDYADDGHGHKGRIFTANIRLKNPYYTTGVANFTPEEAEAFTQSLKEKGHDGIINYASAAMREAGARPNEVIVFDIKSAEPIEEGPQTDSYGNPLDEWLEPIVSNGYTDEATGEKLYDTKQAKTFGEFMLGLISECPEKYPAGSDGKLLTFAERHLSVGRDRHTRKEGAMLIEWSQSELKPQERDMMQRLTAQNGGNSFSIIDRGQGALYDITYKPTQHIGDPYLVDVRRTSYNAPTPAEKSAGMAYTITPDKYTNKKGKTSDVWHVKFNRELTTEEKAAMKAYIEEPLEEGRKISRGWHDRKTGAYIMRSEEAARGLGNLIGNEEAVADAQPLTADDYAAAFEATARELEPGKEGHDREVAEMHAEAEPTAAMTEAEQSASAQGLSAGIEAAPGEGGARTPETRKKREPKKPAPMNRVDVEGLFNDLNTKGETRLSDHAEPATPSERPAEKPAETGKEEKKGLKVDDEMREMEDELRNLLGIDDSEGDRGDLFKNPEDFTNKERMQITSLGITYALKYFDQGVVSFPDFADRMVRRMGEKIRPWLKAFYGGARDIPGYDHLPFTPAEEVKAFDVMNFDKAEKDAALDPMRTAQAIVAEQRAEAAVAEGKREIKEQRNQQRKEKDEQTTADTVALAKEAGAIASEAEATAESATDERAIAEAEEKVDEALDRINEQLALLGYYEAEPAAKDYNEAYGYMRNAEKKALADAVKLARQLVNDLGIEIEKVTSTATATKSKKPTAVRANIAPAGGDISIRLPLNEGRELAISIYLDPTSEPGEPTYSGDNLQVSGIMYRVENPNGTGHDRYGRNQWAEKHGTYADLLHRIQRETYRYLPERSAQEGEYKSGDTIQYSADGGKTWTDGKVVEINGDGSLKLDTGLAPVLYVNATREQVRSGGKKPEKKGKSKKTEVKPEQTVGDLFGGLFDEPKESDEQKENDIRPRTSDTGGTEGHEPRQDAPMGTGAGDEDGGPDGRGMAGRGGGDTVPDTGRGDSVSPVSPEHAVVSTAKAEPSKREEKPERKAEGPLTRLPAAERRNRRNHSIKRGSEIAPASEGARIRANIEALQTLQRLTSSGADATPADMAKLRAFSGWGGLGKAFSDWDLSRQLRQLLGEEGFSEEAQMARNSAYFTPGYVVDAMWDIAKALGFRGGNVLEGSAGIGNIIGLMPPELSDRSRIQAVEKETATGNMLRLLYPDAKVEVQGFEETKIQNGSIDLAITNVPFVPGLRVKDTTGDADLSKRFKDIHNFCIAKNVRKLRDGGIGIFITTKGTLDSTGGLYKWLTNEGNADIVGLFRLHNETFGGTDATSDIIVVRKRVNGQKSPYAIDASTTTGVRRATYTDKEGNQSVKSLSCNRYFVEHPEHMAGEMKFGFELGSTWRPTSVALHPTKDKDQKKLLKAWVKEMSEKDFGQEPDGPDGSEPTNHREEYRPTYDRAGVEVKTGTMQADSKGRICVNYDGELRPLMSTLDKKNPKSVEERIAQFNRNKVKGRTRPQVVSDYNQIKKALSELLEYQKNNEGDQGLQPLIDKLNRAYDSFTATYGHLHRNPAISWLRNDVDYPSILALETYREEGIDHTPVYGKADIFRGRVLDKKSAPKPESVKDGVILSIRQGGNLNTRYIAEALGRPEEEVKKEIIAQGLGYENPTTHTMEPAHLYLSGNVREKLKMAESNNEGGKYDPNIAALRKVVPPSIPAHMIEFSLGSSWLKPELFKEYIKDRTDADLELGYGAGTWDYELKDKIISEKDKSFGIASELCNKIIPGHELIMAAMANKTIRVSRQRGDEFITDQKATQACASRVDEIRDDFKSWLRSKMQQDEALATEIERTYNDTFNNSAPIELPAEYVPEHFEGAATVVNGRPLKLRPHQAKAVVRGTMQSLMLAHEVGTGKTYTLITTAMEMRRLGTAKKPMIVVQNSTLGQFVASAKALYPDARILSLEDKDRNAQGRNDFYAKIRYNDWDMVVIPQSVLEMIDDHPDRKRRFIQEAIDEKMEVMEQLAGDRDNSRIVATMKKEIEKLEDDLAALPGQTGDDAPETGKKKGKKKDEKKEAVAKANAKVKAQEMLDRKTDDMLNFDDLGVDAILVDEAHEYKHLGFATAMQRGVKGVDPSYSKKSQGLFLKVKAIQERTGGRNVVFATGTPISNTAAEIWTFMRYLMPKEEMQAYNIYYFDDFVRNFGSIQQMLEFGPSGKYKEVNRFAGYNNLPEMGRIWAGITDTVLTAEAGEVKAHIPALEGGQPTDIYLPQSSGLRAVLKYVRSVLQKFEEMTGQEKKENSHIPLTMYGIAKAAAVDARLVSASAPDDPHSKTNEAVRQTLRSLKETEKYKGTVAIFADNYQRKNRETGKADFNLFEDIKKKLIAQGVPEEQIWIMNSGMTAKKKEQVFSQVNQGEIRVIMGTTPLLGVGVNIQERLHTLMHLDAPNRPMDYWQRMGRLLRQGNMHKEMGIPVRVLRFGVEDSLDVTAYQRLKTKGAIADAVMNSKALLANNLENRVLEEEGDEFGAITAQLSGSEYAILQNQAEKELRKLLAKEESHRTHQTYIHYKIPEYQRRIESDRMKAEKLQENIDLLQSLPEERTIIINGRAAKGKDGLDKVCQKDNEFLKELIERAETLGTESEHTVKFNIAGSIEGYITRYIYPAMTDSHGKISIMVDTKVTIPGITTKRDLKSRWLKADINEILDFLTPDRFFRLRDEALNDIAECEKSIETLRKDEGKPFEGKERIAELRNLVEEYTEKLQADLEAKEKKYAEMDKEVADLDDISFTSEDDEEEEEETKKEKGRELSRLVTEGNSLDFLDAQGHRSAYRYAQFVPGGLTNYGTGYVREGVRPPMTAIDSETQDWRAPMEFNEWEQSVEGMRKENGKADLVQGNGRTTGNVAYNPYFHIRVHPLNDQFSAAYDRPELVVVEGEYPESELTSGYRAEGAKNAVGLTDWHAGSVNGQLSPGKKVQTVLSRYFKPRRIVPWSEVAERIMDHIEGENVTFPLNVVPPRLRAELSKRGAKFKGISGNVSKDQKAHLDELERQLASGNHDFGVEGGLSDSDIAEYNNRIDRLSSTDPNTMEGAVTLLSDKLHTPIRVISRKEAETEGYRRKKGWYDRETGKITVVADNHRNVGDITDTAIHEAVGHNGLRQLFGTEEKLNNFLDEAYNASSDKIRAEIDRRAERMMEDEVERRREQMRKEREARGENPDTEYYADMAKARVEAEQQREQIRRDATEEYAADLGMKIGEEGFERMDAEELTFWGKIKAKLQKALDMLIAGLKLPKMRKWTDKEWSYVLWRSWRNLREGNSRNFFTEAEDIVRREKSGYGASESRLFRDADMGLEEAITKMKADAAAANGADFAAKQDAMKAVVGNLYALHKKMTVRERWASRFRDEAKRSEKLKEARDLFDEKAGRQTGENAREQRKYDISTAKSIKDLAVTLMEAGLLDKLSNYEVRRIMADMQTSIGEKDISPQVSKLFDIMLGNQQRSAETFFGKLISIKGNRIDHRGIQVQGELDADGQMMMKAFNASKGLIAEAYDATGNLMPDCILAKINDAMNRMASNDPRIASAAATECTGLQLAMFYSTEIKESKKSEEVLREEIRKAEDEMKASQMTKEKFDQFKEATEEAIREVKIKRIEAYHSMCAQLGSALGESVQRAKAWKEREKERINRIHHYANSDMLERPLRGHLKDTRIQKLANNGIVRFFLEPLSTLDQMLKMLGRRNANGEGYLSNFVMRSWIDSADREQETKERYQKRMDDKAAEIFGKRKRWYNGYMRSTPYTYMDLYDYASTGPKASVEYYDGADKRTYELTQDALLYLYAVDKMPMGRATNRRMGITDETIDTITDVLDPKLREYADWVQEELLPDLGIEMDEVHVRMFGAHMDSIDSYFPFVRDKNALKQDVENGRESQPNDRISVQTGSIKKRVASVAIWDIRGMSFLDVLAKHVSDNAHWLSFAELNRDLGTLLSYNRLKQQVMAMSSAYGAGDALWKRFAQCCAIATDAYEPKRATFDGLMVQGTKGVTMGKISFRPFTALKQTLSLPAFVGEVNVVDLSKDILTLGIPAVKWAWRNMPNFRKRILSRTIGDYRLRENEYDSRIMKASSFGMLPNIGVDAWTIAIGSHGVYKTNKRKYLSWGLSKSEAERRAVQDAELCFNKSQQSSEGPFMAPVQIDHTFYATSAMLFRNSSTSYTREVLASGRNLKNQLADRKKQIEFMTKQILRLKGHGDNTWTQEEWNEAEAQAKREWKRALLKNSVNAVMFGWILPWLWRLGGIAPLLLLSSDGDEKAKKREEALKLSMFAPVEGLAYGDVMADVGSMLTGNLDKEWGNIGRTNPFLSDLVGAIKKLDKDWVGATNDVLNILGGMATGINPQTLSDWTVAIMDYCEEDYKTARECALLIGRILNCPQSQMDHVYFDEIDMTGDEAMECLKHTPEEIAKRYAEYKTSRNAPLTGWAYDEEGRRSQMDRYTKRAGKEMKARLNSTLATERTRELINSFEETKEQEKELRKLRKSDREAYRAGMKEIFPDSIARRRHNRLKRYEHDIKRLTEKWLNAKTPAEADSIARAMTGARDMMLLDIEKINAGSDKAQ